MGRCVVGWWDGVVGWWVGVQLAGRTVCSRLVEQYVVGWWDGVVGW